VAEELKPCPFCGSRAAQTSIEGTSWVECPNCDATTWGDASSWNTRAESPELRAIRRAMEALNQMDACSLEIFRRGENEHINWTRHIDYEMAVEFIKVELAKEGVTL